MPNNWLKPRNELVEIGVELARRQCDVEVVAKNMVNRHYMGKKTASAAKQLAQDIFSAWYQSNGCKTAVQEEITCKAAQLQAEGWKMIGGGEFGFLYLHQPTGITVNRCGGSFKSFEEATVITFNSATRQLLLNRSNQ